MKVRWNQNSVRLRITPSELASLLQGDPVKEKITFPGGTSWAITLSAASVTEIVSEGTIASLHLAPADRQSLAAPEAEGVYFQTDSGFRYWVEKDFPCAHPRAAEAAEPTTETFVPPDGFEERKAEG